MSTAVYLEVGQKRTFTCALDWPGWARSGRGEDGALAALADYAGRYAEVARLAGRRPPSARDLEVVQRIPGSGATDFGVPDQVCAADAAPLTARDAGRLAGLVEASWQLLDRAVAALTALRGDISAALRAARSGEGVTPKGWPPRYAARRIAWHVLDHAWEMQDKSDPA